MKRIRAIPEPGSFAAWIEGQMKLIPTPHAFTLANLSGLTPAYFSLLRSGKRKNPSVEVLQNIALAFAELRHLGEDETRVLAQEAMRFAPRESRRMPKPVVMLKERERILQTCHGFDLLYRLGRIDAELDTERRRILGW